jgi:hypothetical protein
MSGLNLQQHQKTQAQPITIIQTPHINNINNYHNYNINSMTFNQEFETSSLANGGLTSLTTANPGGLNIVQMRNHPAPMIMLNP